MGGGFNYVGKVGKVYVVTLTNVNTWYQVLTSDQARAIRGVKVKSRQTYDANGAPTHSPRPFDISFTSSPDTSDSVSDGTGFYSLSGLGSGDAFGPTNGIFCRSTFAGTVIEVMTA